MRKYFLSFVALAAGLFATSCQESIVEPQIAGPTTFTVQLPNQMGTKAIGEASSVTQLLVDVYPFGVEEPIYQTLGTPTSEGFEVELNLIQDQKYDILFWAQTEDGYVDVTETDGKYLFGSLRNVPMNSNYLNNDNGAAFFHAEKGFVPNGTSKDIVLVRPFAQLNLGTTDASLKTNAGTFQLVSSSIEVTGMANQFNVFEGLGFGETVATYDYGTEEVPQEGLSVSGVQDPYNYVSMNYLAVLGNEKALVDVKASIVVKNIATNETQTIYHTFTNVPVQENYRTNIVGNLISSTTDFNITIEEGFVEDESATDDIVSNEYLVVDNVATAKEAFDNGKTHVAINNIGNNQTLQLPDNGKELYLQLPDSDGQITIKRDAGNFNISVPNTNPSNTGLTIIIVAPNSTVDFTGQANVIYSTTASNTLNLNGAEVGTIIVNKGNVVIENQSQVEVLDNQSGGQVTVYVDSTSDVNVPQDGSFVEIEGPTEINSLDALQTVLNYSASDVIVVPNGIVNTSEFTLSLNGKTVTAVDNATGSYGLITNKANLTIVGPGTISLSATNNRAWNAYSSVISNTVGGNLTVGEDVVIEHLGGTDMAYGVDNLTNDKGTSAIATINGATVKSTYRAIRQFLNGIEATNELYVNAGSTILNTTGTNKGIWMQDPSKNANTGKLVVAEGAHVDDVYLSVTAGSTEWPVEVSIASSSLNQGKTVMSSNVPAGYEVVEVDGVWKVRRLVSNASELKAALTNGGLVVLGADIDASNEIVVISKSVTIDGCGHKLTSSAGRAINVSGADGVTIKNLTIECSGERAINIIQGATNVTIDNVTATAANYTVNVAGSAPNAFVDIKNSTLNGLCTVNVAGAGAEVYVNNSTVNCNDNNTTEGEAYAALSLNKDAVKGKIIASETEVNVTEGSDSKKGRNGAEDGEVLINGSTEGVVVMVAAITYPGSDYYYSFASLNEAFEFAQKENRPVTLIRSITVEEPIVIEEGQTVVLDLNGKTIIGKMHRSVGAVIKNNGTLTIKNGTISSTEANGGSAIQNSGTLTVEDATFNGAPNADGSWPSYTVNNTGELIINNSNITSYHGSVASYGDNAIVEMYNTNIDMTGIPGFTSHGIYTYNNGKVTVNGGIIANKATDQAASGASVINGSVTVNAGEFTGRIENYYGTPVLKGGTYSVKPNPNFIADGYKVVEVEEGKLWKVEAE